MSLGATDEDTAYWDVPSFNPNLANYGIWGHAFGAGLKQDPIAGVSGYSTRIYGALVGVDNWVRPFFRLGIAGGRFAKSERLDIIEVAESIGSS